MKKVIFVAIFFVMFGVFVSAVDTPKAKLDYQVEGNKIKVNYNIKDVDEDIIMNDQIYNPCINLYDQETIIQSIQVSEGSGSVEFSNLTYDKTYKVQASVPYDLLGYGKPYNQAPYSIKDLTVKTGKVGDIHSTEEEISSVVGSQFIYVSYDYYDTSGTLVLLDNNKIIEQVQIKEGSNQNYVFDNLEEKMYEVEIRSVKTLDTESFEVSEKKIPPDVQIGTITEKKNKIIVQYDLLDRDNTLIFNGSIKPKISLYKNGEIVDIKNVTVGSDQRVELKTKGEGQYQIQITGQYDLDGDGESENEEPYILDEKNIILPLMKKEPSATLNVSQTNNSAKVDYQVIDEDQAIVEETTLNLLKDGEIIDTKVLTDDSGSHTFENLDSNYDYQVMIVAKYDLDSDGVFENGAPYSLKEISFSTLFAQPEINFTTISDIDKIYVNYQITDPDNVIKDKPQIGIYEENVQIYGEELDELSGNYTFSNLSSNTDYTVEIVTTYGSDQYVKKDLEVTTLIPAPQGYIPVKTCKDLESIGRGENYQGATHDDAWNLDEDYVLIADIDCSKTSDESLYGENGFDSIGNSNDMTGSGLISYWDIDGFTGTFDGQNHKIKNLKINRPETCVGLFRVIEEQGTVKNLGIEDSDISGGKQHVGGLVGVNFGTVKNSFYKGSVVGEYETVGGLVGHNMYGTVQSSFSNANVKAKSSVGGLVGYNIGGSINNSYSSGDVFGENLTGGFAGFSYGTIQNSYSVANSSHASFVGQVYDTSSIKNSFSTGKSKDGFISEKLEFTGKVSNVYEYSDAICSGSCIDYEEVSTHELRDKNWYEDTLKFDENYDLDTIDQGIFPQIVDGDTNLVIPNQDDILLPS